MSKLWRDLFRGQFVVDEPRELVADLPRSQLFATRPEGPVGVIGAEPSPEDEDLLSQVAEMLLVQERLEHLARELSQQQNKPEEEKMRGLCRSLLGVLDGFDRLQQMGLESDLSEDMRNWLKSVAVIQARMTKSLDRIGLKTMDPIGKPVDLDRHEVVEVLHTDSVPDETVVEVRQKGYILGDRILRDARVVVAKNERR